MSKKSKFNKLRPDLKAIYLIDKFDKVINNKCDYAKFELVKFMFFDKSGYYIGIDNTYGDCYVEQFKKREDAINWLNGVEQC